MKWAARPAEARRRWFVKPIRSITTASANSLIVAYKITKASLASGRSRSWKRDPDLPAADTLAPRHTKASAALAVDRGHQAPLAGLGASADWQALNYLSNITPQASDLNQGRGRGWRIRSAPRRAPRRGGGVVRYRAAVRTAYRHPARRARGGASQRLLEDYFYRLQSG